MNASQRSISSSGDLTVPHMELRFFRHFTLESFTMKLTSSFGVRASLRWTQHQKSSFPATIYAQRMGVNTSAVRKPVVWTFLPGPVPYAQALQLQEGMVSARLKAKDALASQANSMSLQDRQSTLLVAETDLVLFCEHAPVYTAGRREQDPEALEEQRKMLTEKTGASFVSTQRGGLTTFHGPGQLMCYPILDLEAMEVCLILLC